MLKKIGATGESETTFTCIIMVDYMLEFMEKLLFKNIIAQFKKISNNSQ
jgi:hypothetical protein